MSGFEYFVTKIDGIEICKLCGHRIMCQYPGFFSFHIHTHLYFEHVNAGKEEIIHCCGDFIELTTKVDGLTYAHSADILVRNIFPQLLFLTVPDVTSFSIKLRDILGKDTLTYALSKDDKSASLIELITTNAYVCVICGECYDSGMPTEEIAFRHVIRCCAPGCGV